MSMAFDQAPFNEDSFMEAHFLGLKEKYNIKNVIETGTYHGVTTAWLSHHFDKVWTTEINEDFYKVSGERLYGCKNVVRLLGSSTKTLPFIIRELNLGNVLVFLDAHWYENPLLQELTILAENNLKPSVLCIHDMKNPNDLTMGYDSYPDQKIEYTYEWVKSYVDAIYGEDGYTYYFNEKASGARRGCLFIIKKI